MRQFLREAGKGGIKKLELGFFSTARYPDGTTVAEVAATQEFGDNPKNGPIIPERPFFRKAMANYKRDMHKIIIRGIDRRKMVIDKRLGEALGIYGQDSIDESIRDLREPPLSDFTIEQRRARGTYSTKPLIDTATMVLAVSYRTE